jgi:hypothetical protein
VDRGIKIVAAGIGFLLLLVVIASISNSGKYYLRSNEDALEIWKGRFAPLGESLIVSISDVPIPEEFKEVYTKEEVFPLAFAHYIDQADNLLETDELPDFEGIKTNASEALEFSLTSEEREKALARLNKIDQMTLIYKADIAASHNNSESLDKALDYLEQAADIDGDQIVANMISEKQKKVNEAISLLEGGAVMEEEADALQAEEAVSSENTEEEAAESNSEEVESEEAAAHEESTEANEKEADAH